MPRTPSKPTVIASDSGPTAERLRQGPVERPNATIADARGQPSRPYRAPDTLVMMQRRGSITAGMRQAGEDFRARFARAQLDPLRAVDLTILRVAEPSLRREEGYVPKISLAYVSPDEADQPLRFDSPLTLQPSVLTRVAPAVERAGIHLAVWDDGGGYSVWGMVRAIPTFCFVLEVAAPGLEDHRLEAVLRPVGGPEVTGVVPPLGQVAVRRLVARQAERRGWGRCGRLCREGPGPGDRGHPRHARRGQRPRLLRRLHPGV